MSAAGGDVSILEAAGLRLRVVVTVGGTGPGEGAAGGLLEELVHCGT